MSLEAETVDKIAELGSDATKARIHTLPNGAVILINQTAAGAETLSPATMDERGRLLNPPSRIVGTPTVQTQESLVEYVKKYGSEGATLFADIDRNAIVAALDYHQDGKTATHNGHDVSLKLSYSEEWKYWTELDRKGLMTQIDFARAIRENAADISAPAAADLLEIVKDLQAVRNVNFTQSVRLNSENESFEYSDDSKATTRKGGVELPDRFTLRIPVYFDGRTYELGAFLRHKIDDGKLWLGIKLHRAEHVRQAVFKELVREVSEASGAPYLYGSQ